MKKYFCAVLLGALALVTAGCGGSNTQEDVGAEFSLFPVDYFSPGFSESYSLSGSDTQNQTYSGKISFQTQVETSYNGTSAVPVLQTLELTNNQTGASSTTTGTDYYSVDDSTVTLLGFSTADVSTASATPGAVPVTASIGEFGATGSYIDNAGNTRVSTWRLNNAGNGRATLFSTSVTTDQEGNVVDTTDLTQVIDSGGVRYSAELRISYIESGISLVLIGSKN